MLSLKPLPIKMRHSAIRLLTKACLSAFVLASAQAANAITFTFTTNTATWIPNPNIAANTRAVQLNSTGTAMVPTSRNFIYESLVSTNSTVGNWIPVGQTLPGATTNAQRFDYNFPDATDTTIIPTTRYWNNNLNLSFGSFYLDGSCSFCGSGNAVDLIGSIAPGTSNGSAKYVDEYNSTTAGNQNSITSKIYDIVFGASGKTGTLQYTAFTNVISGTPTIQENGGTITIIIPDPIIPSSTVPGPLPVLGVGAAFGFSRRLRRRIIAGATRSQDV